MAFGQKWELFRLVRRHPYLWPIIGCLITSPCLAIFTMLSKLDNPDTTRVIRHDPEAFNRFENRQAHIYDSTDFDFEHYQHPRPRF